MRPISPSINSVKKKMLTIANQNELSNVSLLICPNRIISWIIAIARNKNAKSHDTQSAETPSVKTNAKNKTTLQVISMAFWVLLIDIFGSLPRYVGIIPRRNN